LDEDRFKKKSFWAGTNKDVKSPAASMLSISGLLPKRMNYPSSTGLKSHEGLIAMIVADTCKPRTKRAVRYRPWPKKEIPRG